MVSISFPFARFEPRSSLKIWPVCPRRRAFSRVAVCLFTQLRECRLADSPSARRIFFSASPASRSHASFAPLGSLVAAMPDQGAGSSFCNSRGSASIFRSSHRTGYSLLFFRNFSAAVYRAMDGDHPARRLLVWRRLQVALSAASTRSLSMASERAFVAAGRSTGDAFAAL